MLAAGFLAFSIDPLAQKAIDLHPFLSFVVVLFFGALFGTMGTLLALPVTAAVKIVLEELRRPQPAAP